MRPLPADLGKKVNLQRQTTTNAADPRMSVQIARAKTAVIDSTYWTVEEIRKKDGLGDISIAARRLKNYGRPDRLYEIHIDSGVAKTTMREYPDYHKLGWQHQFTLGPAKAVAICFDGDWFRWRSKWRFKTADAPWVFWVDDSNALNAQLWHDAETRITLASGVNQVAAIRGWKNKYHVELDQGLVVLYLKSGRPYYRAYCLQEDGALLWEAEREVTALQGTFVEVNAAVLLDYRLAIIARRADDTLHWAVTERNWAGMAVGAETIYAETNAKAVFTPVKYRDAPFTETVKSDTEAEARCLFARTDNVLTAENKPVVKDGREDFGFKVQVDFKFGIENTPVVILKNVQTGATYETTVAKVDNKTFAVTVDESVHEFGFNDAEGGLEVSVNEALNEARYTYMPMTFTFTPINLNPPQVPLPEVLEVWNE